MLGAGLPTRLKFRMASAIWHLGKARPKVDRAWKVEHRVGCKT